MTQSHRPSLVGRALVALAFLLGFYVLALGAVGALVAANVLLFALAGRIQLQLILLTAFVGWAVLRGVFFVTKGGVAELPGVEVDEQSQPQLLALVREVAADMGTAPPSRVLLVPEVNAWVTQTGGMLGLRPGERVMTIGLGLVDSLSVGQLRAVLAHELGHYAGGDTRLGPLVYRAGASIYRTVENLGDQSLLAGLFDAYGRRYLLLSQRVRRQQELSADAAAVHAAGRESLVSGLRRVAAAAPGFDHFLRWYVVPLWRRGCEPDNVFEGWRAFLEDPSRQEELRRVEDAVRGEPTDRYDSHPSLEERIAHAATLPEGPAPRDDGRPARSVLDQTDGAERQVSRHLTRQATGGQVDRAISWDEAAEVLARDLAEDGEVLLHAAGELLGDPEAANLDAVVRLLEAGRSPELAAALTGPLEELPEEQRDTVHARALEHHLGSAVGAYLAAERGHVWTLSWAGPPHLVDERGKRRDPFGLASSLIEDPGFGRRLRRSLGPVGRLAAFRATPMLEGTDRSSGPEVVEVVPDVKAKGGYVDVVLTTAALVLHPIAKTSGDGVRRALAAQGLEAPARKAAQRRLAELFSRPPTEVFGEDAGAGAKVFPLAGVHQARRRWPYAIEMQVGPPCGATSFRMRFPTKAARNALLEALQRLQSESGAAERAETAVAGAPSGADA